MLGVRNYCKPYCDTESLKPEVKGSKTSRLLSLLDYILWQVGRFRNVPLKLVYPRDWPILLLHGGPGRNRESILIVVSNVALINRCSTNL